MVLSGCSNLAATRTKTPDYIVTTVLPRAQAEDKSIAYPQCQYEITGDLIECLRDTKQAFCMLVAQYSLYMRRASRDKDDVIRPAICQPYDDG